VSKTTVEWDDHHRREGFRTVTIIGLPGPEARRSEEATLLELRRELHAKFRKKIDK
jgi:hypothetical protein